MTPTKNAMLGVLIALLLAAIILDWNNWVFSGLLLISFLVLVLYQPKDRPPRNQNAEHPENLS